MRTMGLLGGVLLGLATTLAASAAGDAPECIAPANPGGGFDLTCRLVQRGLAAGKRLREPMRLTYMPGGVGVVAYDAIVAQRPAEGDTMVAFSGGSLLNLAQGKFGKHTEADVKWLAAVGLDYGMLAVRADSPLRTLADLVAAVRNDPSRAVFGVAGAMGGQDWVKAARVAGMAGLDPRRIRYVSFEGGGEAFLALKGGHIEVVSADILEASVPLGEGAIRMLAVFADRRLPGRLAGVPTAREQGFALSWPDIRGVYMGPKVSDGDYARWIATFEALTASPEFAGLREEFGLFPFSLTGPALTAFVKKTVQEYRGLARELGLPIR